MKLILKSIIAIAIIALASANMRTRTETKDGSGTWAGGYTCPKVFFNLKGGAEVDNGEAVLQADQMDKGTTNEDKLGLVLTFKNDIKTDLSSNVVVVSGKKVYIPWRNFNTVTPAEYTNPFGDNKYIKATVEGDDGKKYTLKILLPYKTFGYYINDTEGRKIALKIKNNANSSREKVSHSKSDIIKSTNDLITANNALEKFKKDKASAIASSEKDLVDFATRVTDLEARKKAIDAKLATAAKAFEIEQNAHIDIREKIYSVNSQIANTKDILKGLNTPGEDGAQSLTLRKTKSSGDLDLKIQALKTQAANRVPVVDTAATAAKAFKINDVLLNLKKIVPTSN